MSTDSTEVYKAVYYLIGSKNKIKIDKTVTLGRGNTDISIKDAKLSTTHCKITIRGLKLFITDLNSTNGTSINGENLAPQIDKELKLTDKIKIGSEVYTLSDNNNSLSHNSNSFSDNDPISFQARNFINFFNISVGLKAWYLISSILLLIIFYAVMGNLDHLPKNLSFLHTLCLDERLTKLPFIILTLYIINFLHAYITAFYLKKSHLFQIITLFGSTLIAFVFTFFYLINSRHNDISDYLKTRSDVIEQTNMKDVKIKYEKIATERFILVYEAIPVEFKPILKKDFETFFK